MKFKVEDLKGVYPALITVFDEQENIDVEGTKTVVNHLINEGVHGLYLVGSTGEGFTMSIDERKEYIKLVVDIVDGRIPIMVHVGMIGTKNSIELAQYAEQVGADAISSVPPFYWKFTEDEIYNYYKDISDSTSLPMIVYNVPMAGLMAVDFIKRLSEIENVKGVKFTALTHHDIIAIRQSCGEEFIVFSGCDEMSLSGLYNGADGLIGSFVNLMPELFLAIYDSFIEGEFTEAIKFQMDLASIIALALQYNYYSIIKSGLTQMGVNAGYTRKPFTRYTDVELEDIWKRFRKLRDDLSLEHVSFLKDM